MSNTLTGLVRTLYTRGADVVSRELTGFIPAVTHNPALSDGGDIRRAAKDQTVTVHVSPARTAANATASQLPPDTGDATQGTVNITISKSRSVPIRYEGEEIQSLENSGIFDKVFADDVQQSIRTLVNEIETDLGSLYAKASRAHGTAGTTPFGTANNLTDSAGAARILDDNGCPDDGERQLVLGSAAWANLRGVQSVLFKVNEAGTSDMLRRGMADELHGFALRKSKQVASHTKGTMTGLDFNGGEPIGETSWVVDGGDSGTLVNGDVLTAAGDTNKYILTDGSDVTGSASGTLVMAEPGLVVAAADTVELTVGNSYTANMAFHRSAIVLATRGLALPRGGDSAASTALFADPMTGLVFEIAEYKEHLRAHWQVRIAWGYELIKPEHTCILLG